MKCVNRLLEILFGKRKKIVVKLHMRQGKDVPDILQANCFIIPKSDGLLGMYITAWNGKEFYSDVHEAQWLPEDVLYWCYVHVPEEVLPIKE